MSYSCYLFILLSHLSAYG